MTLPDSINTKNLSEKELKVLEELIAIAKKKERKISYNRNPSAPSEEYVCRFEIQCRTCKKVYHESYYMEPDRGIGASIGMMIPEDKITDCCKIKTQERQVLTCNFCTERLMLLDKADIIKMYLKEKKRWI